MTALRTQSSTAITWPGILFTITYPSGRVVTQTYDPIGRLNQIASGATNYLSGVQYNPAHAPTGFNYGNGVATEFGYNARMQLGSLRYSQAGADLFKLTYDYGTTNNGQIQSITDNVDASRSMTYIYDAWARLKTATAGPVASPTWKLGWDYDRFGNRKNQNVLAGSAPAPQLDISPNTNRITSTGYLYDASGNLTNDTLHSYTYDGENRIAQVDSAATASYSYDGTGLRVKKAVGAQSTRYIFSGTKVIAEYVNGVLGTEYIYAGSQLVATLSSAGAPTYHHPDHLSTRVSTDSVGSVVRQFSHFPFGEAWYETGAVDKWKFTSYERDSESGLDYAMFRYDSSRLGRFMTPDPLAGSLLDPQSLNRYAYVRNDPVNLIDPLGLMHNCLIYILNYYSWSSEETYWDGFFCDPPRVQPKVRGPRLAPRPLTCPRGYREATSTEAQQILEGAKSEELNLPYGFVNENGEFTSYVQRCNQFVCEAINRSGVMGSDNVDVNTTTVSESPYFAEIGESEARAGDVIVFTGGPRGNHMGFLVPGSNGALDVLSATSSQPRPEVAPEARGGPRPRPREDFKGKQTFYRICVRDK